MRFGTFVVLVFSSFVYSYAAGADDAVENITVTASRTPLGLLESGSSITVISRDQLAQRNALNLAELLREVPGIAVSQQGAIGSIAQVRIRGAEANQVLVLIDGIEANDIAQGSEFNFASLLAGDIERVEIVRGPQSALWGSDALSGVINVITRPQNDAISGMGLTLQSGSFDTFGATFSAQHSNDVNRIRLSINRLHTNGTNIARQGSEDDGYENSTVNVAGTFRPSDVMAVNYSMRHVDLTSEFDEIDVVTTGLPVDADNETNTEQLYGGISVAFSLLDGSLDQIFSIARTETENINRTASPVPDTSRGIKDKLEYQTNYYHGHHVASVVFEAEAEDYRQRGQVYAWGDPNKNLDTRTRSVAVEYRYDSDPIDFSLSTRHDNNADFDSANSWRATLAWHLDDATSLYSSVGESIKNPTFTERYGFFETFLGNPGLEPEESLSWELGIRRSLYQDRASLAASWYHADLTNEINGFVFEPISGKFTAENTDGKSKRQGAELQFALEVNDWMSVTAAYSYLDATEDDAVTGSVDEVRRPTNSASVSAAFAFPKTNISLAVIYTGEQKDDYFPPWPSPPELVELDSFTLVNLSARYQVARNLELTLRLANLLDQSYEEVFGFAAPRRSAQVGLAVSF